MNDNNPPVSDLSNVYEIFSGRPIEHTSNNIIRIAPELDGLEMLYSNDSSPNKLYSLKVVCWALREDGEVFGMVPWLNNIVACTEIDDPLNGRWEGYRDPNRDDIFYLPPHHKILELEASVDYYSANSNHDGCIQEIPDTIGTHAVMTTNGFRTFSLVEIFSWQLMADGTINGMVVDEKAITQTPVLPGDKCLHPTQSDTNFRYFFQHRIANKIKEHDPEALAALAMLIEK